MPFHAMSCASLLLLGVLISGSRGLQNDATEMAHVHAVPASEDTASNASLNRARSGGRAADSRAAADQGQVACRELRSTKYISDGQCTSLSPVKELVCAGECLPSHLLPNWIGGPAAGRYWSRRDAQEWRCVNDKARTQRIHLQCRDGSARTYRITVVTACKCKRYSRQHNDSGHRSEEAAQSPVTGGPRRRKGQGRMELDP
ncbi:sclerostin domain-containing protein 1b [Denticeps clupeoides]|uniref:CTCK domain-containing protein n=1 Tax=Denticeps clupeoides TaxID=299321 RepID=A0AAY4CPM4_9TELE|nr:sclerostin domain-containing protein 1-like [Denticeps clupeoides]